VKFLADMGIAESSIASLRAQGYDATHLREQALQRPDDESIIAKARDEGRVILTHDLDFGRIVALSRAGSPSAITFRLGDMRPSRVNHYLSQVLARFSGDLEKGALVSVNERGIRVRPLPILPGRG
jgi:predicted nuclease of predicted toxin-antitoxin system